MTITKAKARVMVLEGQKYEELGAVHGALAEHLAGAVTEIEHIFENAPVHARKAIRIALNKARREQEAHEGRAAEMTEAAIMIDEELTTTS